MFRQSFEEINFLQGLFIPLYERRQKPPEKKLKLFKGNSKLPLESYLHKWDNGTYVGREPWIFHTGKTVWIHDRGCSNVVYVSFRIGNREPKDGIQENNVLHNRQIMSQTFSKCHYITIFFLSNSWITKFLFVYFADTYKRFFLFVCRYI